MIYSSSQIPSPLHASHALGSHSSQFFTPWNNLAEPREPRWAPSLPCRPQPGGESMRMSSVPAPRRRAGRDPCPCGRTGSASSPQGWILARPRKFRFPVAKGRGTAGIWLISSPAGRKLFMEWASPSFSRGKSPWEHPDGKGRFRRFLAEALQGILWKQGADSSLPLSPNLPSQQARGDPGVTPRPRPKATGLKKGTASPKKKIKKFQKNPIPAFPRKAGPATSAGKDGER